MPKPIRCILLVDDDPDDNFLHQIVIDESGLCDQVRISTTGAEALRYLTDTTHPNYIRPDVILTDINLPGMNGFEFLERYQQLDDQLKCQYAVLVLTTSFNPLDTKRAALFPEVKGYFAKPLSDSILQSIVNQHIYQ